MGRVPRAVTSGWLQQRERGSVVLTRFMVWLALQIGRPVARLLLHPIALYFLVFSPRSRRASLGYLRRALAHKPSWRDAFRHYHTFAATLLDRVHFLSGRTSGFDVMIHGTEQFDATLAEGRGLIMLGAHFGSFDVLRSIATHGQGLRVNILTHEDNATKIGAVLAALAPDMQARVIPLGRPETFIRVKERLDAGEIVGILGDRGLPGEAGVPVGFLGADAAFPRGPMILAGVLGAPVVFFAAVYRGGNRYEIFLERFADRIMLDRRDREASIRAWIERYAARLEHHCRAAPYNWFNFYDFWTVSRR